MFHFSTVELNTHYHLFCLAFSLLVWVLYIYMDRLLTQLLLGDTMPLSKSGCLLKLKYYADVKGGWLYLS